MQESRALEIIKAKTTSDKEANAVFETWKNRVVPTGNLEADIDFAIGGTNSKKIISRNSELKRALNNKERVSKDDISGQDKSPKVEPKLADNSPLKNFKYVGNGVYVFKLSSGKLLYKNPKAKPGERKTWIEDPKK